MDHLHYKLYKPYGTLSQLSSHDARQLRTKRFLTELYDFPQGTMPIGRLDEKSEGLLLLTTDGKLSNIINTSGVEKEYYAQVDGAITPEAIALLQSGVTIGIKGGKYLTKPCKVYAVGTTPTFPERGKKIRDKRHGPAPWIRLILKEGKFRQVRKMTSAVGFPTLRLVRTRVGVITLETLAPGEVSQLETLI